MSVNAEKFSLLLHEGVTAIQKHESREKKKTRRKIYEELGVSIDRKASTIEFFLQNNVPTSYIEIEKLAKTIYSRGNMDAKWLGSFLSASGYKDVTKLVSQLSAPSSMLETDQNTFQTKRLRHYFNVTFYPDRRNVTTVRIEVQSTWQYEVSTIRHRSLRGFYASETPRILEFEPISRSGIGTMKHHVFTNVPDFLQWNVNFDPPLQPNETAIYEYRLAMKNVKPWTLEECRSFFQQGLIPGIHSAANILIGVPTDVLDMSVVLPANYEIDFPGSGGFRATLQNNEDLTEKTKIIKEKLFQGKLNAHNNQWELELYMKNPKVGYVYGLEWIPPSERDLTD